MNMIRKSIATVVVAVLGAPALTTFAMSPADSYGRAGGAASVNLAPDVESDGQRNAVPVNWYGRAGAGTGAEKVSQVGNMGNPAPRDTATQTVPGRQGHVLTIDEVRG